MGYWDTGNGSLSSISSLIYKCLGMRKERPVLGLDYSGDCLSPKRENRLKCGSHSPSETIVGSPIKK